MGENPFSSASLSAALLAAGRAAGRGAVESSASSGETCPFGSDAVSGAGSREVSPGVGGESWLGRWKEKALNPSAC